jgi:hypothetical protein
VLRALSVGVAIVMTAASAPAKPKVIVFPVVPLPGEVELAPAGQMTNAILVELGQQDELDAARGQLQTAAVVDPGPQQPPAKSDAEYRAALGQLAEGTELAQKLRFPQAIEALRAGIDGLTRNLELMDDYDRLLDAYVLLAVAHFRRGQQRDGTDVLEQLARLRPDFDLDRSKYPPVFTSELDDARRRALACARGGLRVTSAPAGAEVFINGRRMGTTPILVEEIIPGKNHLVLRHGGRAWGEQVFVREEVIRERHADLGTGGRKAPVTLGDALAANRFDEEVRSAARRIARGSGGDYALVSAMGRGEGTYTVSAYLGNVRSGAWTALEPLSPDYDMLSDTIEAHSLARQVARQLGGFSNNLEQDELPLIAGKTIHTAVRVANLKESQAVFVAPSMERAVDPAFELEAEPIPQPDREPALAADLVDTELAAPAAAPELATAATGPLSADVEQEAAPAGGSLLEAWWFWTIVGVGAAALAGGGIGTYYYFAGRDAESVTVYAAW